MQVAGKDQGQGNERLQTRRQNTVVAQTWAPAQNVPASESDKVDGKQVFTAKPSL